MINKELDNFILACESYMINDEDLVMEGILDKNIKIVQYPKTKYEDATTNLKYKNIPVKISVPTNGLNENEYQERIISLSKDSKIIKKFNKLIDEEFNNIIKTAREWGMDVNNGKDIQKNCKMNSITYLPFKNGISIFEIWFNPKTYNSNFFGGHSLIFEIKIKDDDIKNVSYSIEG